MKKTASWAGILGTVLFTLSFTLNGWLRPDYHPMQMYVSELAIGPSGWIQMVSFIGLGISFMLFSPGIRATFPTGSASRAAPILLGIIGISYVFSGVFVTDPQAMFDNQQTLHGIVHGVFGAMVFSLSAASCFVLWHRFRVDAAWRPLATFSLAAGIAMCVLIVLMKIGQLQTGLLHQWAGVVQRCCLLISYAWIFVISLRMKKQG